MSFHSLSGTTGLAQRREFANFLRNFIGDLAYSPVSTFREVELFVRVDHFDANVTPGHAVTDFCFSPLHHHRVDVCSSPFVESDVALIYEGTCPYKDCAASASEFIPISLRVLRVAQRLALVRAETPCFGVLLIYILNLAASIVCNFLCSLFRFPFCLPSMFRRRRGA